MRTRYLLPALLLAALPLPAHADHQTAGGVECSVQGLTFTTDDGASWRAPVGAVWAIADTSIARMTLHCSVWEGDASFQAGDPPVHTYDASSSHVPTISMATVSTFRDASELVWCMTLRAYDANDVVVDSHDRCYVQAG